jgi:hypothetical protein
MNIKTAISLAALTVSLFGAQPVLADGTETKTETVCETNSYGQKTCREVTTTTKGIDRVGQPAQMTNTAVTSDVALAVAALTAAGVFAAAYTARNNK